MKTRSYSCPNETCNKSFRTEQSLSDHLKTHKNEVKRDPKDFKCYVCSRVLSTKQSLVEHSFTHKEKKYFRCSEVGCGKLFRQNSQLCNHRKLHKIEKRRQKMMKAKEIGLKKKEEDKRDGQEEKVILPLITGPMAGVILPGFSLVFK